jgi:predicted RND superfamily exporter protein
MYKSFSYDPFQLIPLSRGASGQYAGAQSAFASYNGYMMTADQTLGFAFLDSPYGSTETQNNKAFLDSLSNTILKITSQHPSVDIRLLGAPVVAVENANRIKKDTILIIIVSSIAFIFLLLYAFPRRKDIFLILLSVAFGALFGTAALAIFAREVSMIVLGIGAILMGIAINYPLHLLVHQRYTTSVQQTLREVLSPLIVGNISTIGAFMVLLPLQAPALKQLGIFSSAMLLGTILFCVFILPHLMSSSSTIVREIPTPNFSNKYKQILPYIIVPLLIILLLTPCVTSGDLFDSNLSNINYMTSQQRKDFAFFESVAPQSAEPAYLVNDAKSELNRRLELWNQYWQLKDIEQITNALNQAAASSDFRSSMFSPFLSLISQPYLALDLSNKDNLVQVWPGKFDTTTMNAKITTALSENFDYIGIFCSIIVFLFLWMSFHNILLAFIAFIPMAVSMGLVVGIMHVTGLQFNIVNIILATFIFGQGDDYTIFVLEGCMYELKTGKKILSQYKQSIILSALMMLIGIGVLVLAKHPAMFSLGVVTLIGMACVVAMAYFLPPFLLQVVCKIPALKTYILK